jgi:hypothetical protein
MFIPALIMLAWIALSIVSFRVTDLKKPKILTWLLAASVLTLIISSVKGWYLFILGPLLLLTTPLILIPVQTAVKLLKEQFDKVLFVATWLHLMIVPSSYLFVVGFGDTKDVMLFNLYGATSDSPLVGISTVIAGIFQFAAIASTVYLITEIRRVNRQRKTIVSPTTP